MKRKFLLILFFVVLRIPCWGFANFLDYVVYQDALKFINCANLTNKVDRNVVKSHVDTLCEQSDYFSILSKGILEKIRLFGFDGFCAGKGKYLGRFYIDRIINSFSRDIAVLEMFDGKDIYCDKWLGKNGLGGRVVNYILLVITQHLSDDEKIEVDQRLAALSAKKYSNLVILKPKHFEFEDLIALSKSEDVDIVIVHDLEDVGWGDLLVKDTVFTEEFINTCCDLGKLLVLKTSKGAFLNSKNRQLKYFIDFADSQRKSLFFFEGRHRLEFSHWFNAKRGLQNSFSSSTSHCPPATYDILEAVGEGEKFFKKCYFVPYDDGSCDEKCEKILWIPGINLLTFVGLGGLYPTLKMILNWLEDFRVCIHNDFVMSNILLIGKSYFEHNRLKLIDENDLRRKFNVDVGFKILKEFFGSSWQEDPETALLEYINKSREVFYKTQEI